MTLAWASALAATGGTPAMLTRIFPRAFDNHYRGYRIAIWLFVPLVLIRL